MMTGAKQIATNKYTAIITALCILLGGGGTIAKINLFDPLLKPLKAIIYHQKILINLYEDYDIDTAKDRAENEMFDEGYWSIQ